MNRWRAFAGHLMISGSLVAALVALFVAYLFPMPFFTADGGWQGIRIIALVDVTIGPLLTLIVCSKGKERKKLLFDLTVIGFLQLAALTAGFWTVYSSRTESVLFVDGTFYAIDALTAKSLGPRYRELAAADRRRPLYAVIDLPDDPNARQSLRSESLAANNPLFRKVELLAPLGSGLLPEISSSVAKSEKVLASPRSREALKEWLDKRGLGRDDVLVVPTWCRYEKIVTLIDRKTGLPVGHLTGIEVGS